MKAYSQDLRERVINAYNNKIKTKQIIETFQVSINTIYDWVKRFKANGDYTSKQGKVVTKKPRFNDKEAILKFIENNPDANGIMIRDAIAPELPMTTFYDTMKRLGITYKKRSKIQIA